MKRLRPYLLTALAACGGPENGPVVDPPVASLPDEPAAEPAVPLLRRLTTAQYEASVVALLGELAAAPVRLEPDVDEAGFASVGAGLNAVSALGVERYETAAGQIADRLVAEGALPDVLACVPSSPSDRACADEALAALGRRAYRRPLDATEAAVLGDLWEELAQAHGTETAWRDLITALLQSPYFLYRVELGDDQGQLTDHEWLTRTTFLLFATPPDDALLDMADAGELASAEGRAALVDRMIDDPRLADGVRAFVTEWWHLDGLNSLDKDPLVFPHAHPDLGPAALEETLSVVADLVLGDQDFRDLLTTRRSYIDPRLAALYGVPAPNLDGFGWTELPGTRPGILGQVSFLALHAHATRTSATDRGIFVRSTLLCQTIPAPPADVNTELPEPDEDAPTLRDRLAVHLESPACAGCHALTDPIGFAFETFDGVGRYRTTEGGALIDTSGDLDGAPFADGVELAEALRDDPTLVPCWSTAAWHYATGRTYVPLDTTDWLADTWSLQGHALRPMLRELVLSDAFAAVEAP